MIKFCWFPVFIPLINTNVKYLYSAEKLVTRKSLNTDVHYCQILFCFQYLAKKLGIDSVTFGYLQTTFALVQLAGGPIFGRFGDLLGGRAALTLAFASSALTYGILGFANSVVMVFLSRLPSIFMHSMQGRYINYTYILFVGQTSVKTHTMLYTSIIFYSKISVLIFHSKNNNNVQLLNNKRHFLVPRKGEKVH